MSATTAQGEQQSMLGDCLSSILLQAGLIIYAYLQPQSGIPQQLHRGYMSC